MGVYNTKNGVLPCTNGATSLSPMHLILLHFPHFHRHFGQETSVTPLSARAARTPDYRLHPPDGPTEPSRAGPGWQALWCGCPSLARRPNVISVTSSRARPYFVPPIRPQWLFGTSPMIDQTRSLPTVDFSPGWLRWVDPQG